MIEDGDYGDYKDEMPFNYVSLHTHTQNWLPFIKHWEKVNSNSHVNSLKNLPKWLKISISDFKISQSL